MNGNQDPEIQFYNAIIANPYIPNGTNVHQPAVFSTTLQTALLEDPSKYYMSIVRFTIPNSDVPIFNFVLKDSVASATNGVYGIAIEYNGVVVSQNLTYVNTKSTQVDLGVYHYQEMLDMINTALKTAYTTISGSLPINCSAPFVSYDPATGLLSLFASIGYDSNAATPVKIWFNGYLWNMVNSFSLMSDSFPNAGSNADNRDYQIKVQSDGNNFRAVSTVVPWRAAAVSALAFYEMKQEYNSLFLWNDCRGIRFTSTTIPVVEEFSPAVTTQANTNTNINSGSTSYIKILSDMEIQASSDPADRSIISYVPSAQYRFVQMAKSSTPFRQFSFQIFAVDKFNNTIPLTIASNQSITVKFLFIRKDLNDDKINKYMNKYSV